MSFRPEGTLQFQPFQFFVSFRHPADLFGKRRAIGGFEGILRAPRRPLRKVLERPGSARSQFHHDFVHLDSAHDAVQLRKPSSIPAGFSPTLSRSHLAVVPSLAGIVPHLTTFLERFHHTLDTGIGLRYFADPNVFMLHQLTTVKIGVSIGDQPRIL